MINEIVEIPESKEKRKRFYVNMLFYQSVFSIKLGLFNTCKIFVAKIQIFLHHLKKADNLLAFFFLISPPHTACKRQR